MTLAERSVGMMGLSFSIEPSTTLHAAAYRGDCPAKWTNNRIFRQDIDDFTKSLLQDQGNSFL
jgi:hypothetical protein